MSYRPSVRCFLELDMLSLYARTLVTRLTNLKTVVRPGTELESAFLVVERKISDVDFARAAQLDWRRPEDDAFVRHHRLALHRAIGEVFHTNMIHPLNDDRSQPIVVQKSERNTHTYNHKHTNSYQ